MDSFIRVVDNELVIPGVKGTHVFMHISDLHLIYADEDSSPEEKQEAAVLEGKWMKGKESFAKSFGEPFGEAQKIPTAECLDRLLEYAREEKPEAILLTGDNMERTERAAARYLVSSLKNCGIPYLCVKGNHETGKCPGAWEQGVSVLECDGFRIVGVNDSKLDVSARDMERLEQLAAEEIPMIVIYHVPVAASGNRDEVRGRGGYFCIDGEKGTEGARRFTRFIETCPLVKMTLCGHIHGYTVNEIVPGKRQITASQAMIGFIHRLTVRGE